MQARVRAFANLRPRKHEEFRLRSLAGSPLLRVPPVSCLPSSFESRGILVLRERAASVLLEDVVDRRRSFNALRSLNVCLLYSFLFHSDSVETLSLSLSLFLMVNGGACHSRRHRFSRLSLLSYVLPASRPLFFHRVEEEDGDGVC